MSVKSVEELKSLVTAYGRVAHAGVGEIDKLETCVEACKAYLKQAGQQFLIAHASQPILQQFCMDTTPTHYREYVGSGPNPKIRGRMSGPARAELLVQFTSFSCLEVDGSVANRLVFRDPIAVTGRKTAQQLAAIAAACPCIFADGADPEVVRLKHVVFDRGVPVGIAHFLSGHWHRGHESVPSQGSSGGQPSSSGIQQPRAHSSRLHWHTYVGCVCHDLHNALKWSMAAEFQDTELLKKIYSICVASRHLYMPVFTGLGQALPELLVPSDPDTLPTPTQLRDLWESLQLGEALVDELVFFRIICMDGTLYVDQDAMKDPQALQRLSACLMGVWAFKTFSASRWLTIGLSCRTLVAAWLSGYELILAYLDRQDKLPSYEMTALNATDQSCRRFVCLASYAALLPEALLAFVFKDNRVAKNQHILLDMCWSGLHLIEGLDDFTLRLVGQIGGNSVPEMHHSLLKATLIQLAYLDFRVFNVARSWPWYLCAGNVEKNLEALSADHTIRAMEHDHVTQSVIDLLDLGYSRLSLIRAIQLLGEASWSSFLVEKMHASTSVVHKHRPELGLNHLLCRAFMHMFSQLLTRASPLGKVLSQLERRWWKTAGRKPQYIGGRQMFLAVLMEKLHITNEGRRSRGQHPVLSSDVMASHGKLWRKLSDVERKGYSELASRARSTMDRHGLELEASLEAQMHECWAEEKQNQLNGSHTLTFQSAALQDADLSSCLDLLQTLDGHHALVLQKRQKEMHCPDPLPEAEYEQWRGHSVCVDHGPRTSAGQSQILRRVSHQRDNFSDAVFELQGPDGVLKWWRFVFSLQKPVLVFFLPLQATYVPVQLDVTGFVGKDLRDFTNAVPTMLWTFDHADMTAQDPFVDQDLSTVSVYMTTLYESGSRVVTYDVAYPLDEVLSSHAALSNTETDVREAVVKGKNAEQEVSAEMMAQNPWIASFLASQDTKSRAASSTASKGASSTDAAAVPACETAGETEPLQDIFDQAFSALEAARQEDHIPNGQDGFVFSLLAGQWQIKRTGRTVYGHRCDCKRDSLARIFASAFQLPLSASFEQTKFGERGSALMVELWSRRMQSLAEGWDRQGRPEMFLEDESAIEFEATTIIEELNACLPAAGRKRFRDTCTLWPKVQRGKKRFFFSI